MPGRVPVGGHGTRHRRERNGRAQVGRRVLLAHHRVRRAAGVRVIRIVDVRLRAALHPAVCGDRHYWSHIAQTTKQVSVSYELPQPNAFRLYAHQFGREGC